MNILFVVCGEGLGHASRSFKLATYLENQGCKCHFAAYGKAFEFIRKSDHFPIHRTPREVTLDGEEGFFSMSKTLWSSKGVLLQLVRSMRNVQQLIRDHNIDLVIADTMYAAVPAAKMEGKKAIFVTNQNKFATATDEDSIPWKALSLIVEKYLTIPDAVVIPDFARPCTISDYNFHISEEDGMQYHFVGPMMSINRDECPKSQETIFASFGGEPFKVPLYGMLRKIADQRPDLNFEVFSTATGLPPESENFHTYGYVRNIHQHLAKARVAILHGGLTTLHESLFFNKSSVMIIDPYHPEQWNNARKIVDLGAGIMIEGNGLDEAKISSAIDSAMKIVPPDYTRRFNEEDGRKNTYLLIKEIMKKNEIVVQAV